MLRWLNRERDGPLDPLHRFGQHALVGGIERGEWLSFLDMRTALGVEVDSCMGIDGRTGLAFRGPRRRWTAHRVPLVIQLGHIAVCHGFERQRRAGFASRCLQIVEYRPSRRPCAFTISRKTFRAVPSASAPAAASIHALRFLVCTPG